MLLCYAMIYDDFNLPPASLWPREFPGGKNLSPKQNLKPPVSSKVKVVKLTFCNEAESIVDKLCKVKKSRRKRKTEKYTYFTLLFHSNFFSILDVIADNYFIRDKITYDCCKQVLATKYHQVRQNLYPTWTSL